MMEFPKDNSLIEHQLTSVLSECLTFEDNKSYRNFIKLSEEEKVELSSELISSLYRNITDRRTKINDSTIDVCFGDITKLKDYDILNNTLKLLTQVQSVSKTKIAMLDELVYCHENLIKFTPQFKNGFRINKSVIKLLFESVASSLIVSTSFLLISTLDYIKNSDDSIEVTIKNNSNKTLYEINPTYFYSVVTEFNLLVRTGKINNFFVQALEKDSFIGSLSVGTTMALMVLIIPVIFKIIRMGIYQWFNLKIKLSEYLKLQAEYLEFNVRTLNNTPGMEKVAVKQRKVADSFLKLADKLSVDQVTAYNKTKQEVSHENKELNVEKLSNSTLPSLV